jgi:decaprenyl-phosphate phosphoribosyltransferase
VVDAAEVPPISLLLAYWMLGAFFMAAKRFAEYRAINDSARAALYRASFRSYDEPRLLGSMFFYVAMFASFLGIFIVRYHLELIFAVPLIAALIWEYVRVAHKAGSAAQHPERLYRERGLVLCLIVCTLVFLGLLLVQAPVLHDWFNVPASGFPPLWNL